MKKVIIGITFILSGLAAYLVMHQNAVNYLPHIGFWDNSLGKFGQALKDTGGLIPAIISICFMVIGIIILAIDYTHEFQLEKENEIKKSRQNKIQLK